MSTQWSNSGLHPEVLILKFEHLQKVHPSQEKKATSTLKIYIFFFLNNRPIEVHDKKAVLAWTTTCLLHICCFPQEDFKPGVHRLLLQGLQKIIKDKVSQSSQADLPVCHHWTESAQLLRALKFPTLHPSSIWCQLWTILSPLNWDSGTS